MISNFAPTNSAHLARTWEWVWRRGLGRRATPQNTWQDAGGANCLAWMQTGIPQTVATDTSEPVTGNSKVRIPRMTHARHVQN